MRKLILIPLFFILGCVGNNLKTEVEKTQKEKDIVNILGESVTKQKEFKPNHVNVKASGNSIVKVNVPDKKDTFESSNKGTLGASSSFDFDFKGENTFSSSWYYLIIAVAFILFIVGIKLLRSQLDQMGISGGLKLGASWLSELANFRKETTDNNVNRVLAELESRLERKYGKLQRKKK